MRVWLVKTLTMRGRHVYNSLSMNVWHDLPWAQAGAVSPNEQALDQKHPTFVPPEGRDTVKFRFGSWAGMFGWISGDRLTGDERNPTRREKVGIKLGETPVGDGGLVEIHLQRPNTTEDKDMVRVMTLTSYGIEFHVPVRGVVAAPPRVSRFYSDDGRYCFNVQGDGGGHIVQYDTNGTSDETQWMPVGQFRAEP